jgi:hypothetical protein
MEKAGYVFLGTLAVLWIIAMIVGMVVAMPWGIIGLVAAMGIGFLLIKVIKDRMNNKEDDYYSDNVDR